jgi:hypothetical protein
MTESRKEKPDWDEYGLVIPKVSRKMAMRMIRSIVDQQKALKLEIIVEHIPG